MSQPQPIPTANDQKIFGTQAQRIFIAMSEKPTWWSLPMLAKTCTASEAGVSARLRDFRKAEWGSHQVKRMRSNDLSLSYWYRLIPNGPLLDGKRNTPTAKTEARERVTAFLVHRGLWQTNEHYQITTYGPPLLASDLRELLK